MSAPKRTIDRGPWVLNGTRKTDGLVERLDHLLQDRQLLRNEFDTADVPRAEMHPGWYRLQHPVQLAHNGHDLHIPVGLWIVVPLQPRLPDSEPAFLDIQGDHVIIRVPYRAFDQRFEHHYSITATGRLNS